MYRTQEMLYLAHENGNQETAAVIGFFSLDGVLSVEKYNYELNSVWTVQSRQGVGWKHRQVVGCRSERGMQPDAGKGAVFQRQNSFLN